jgi:5-methyltetrahydrofolate--homocysteine methyltransferase
MKQAVAHLIPYMEEEKARSGLIDQSNGKVVMATVKGDVHDIGKNIVGVVLQCNGYDVIDLGVMVSCDTILEAAVSSGADMIGLSGLITPSLDEMSFVAAEMQRRGMTIPLLIGGATTSRTHTALKIAPHYKGPTIYVTDASRAVPVVQKLLSDNERPGFVAETNALYARAREAYLAGQDKRARLPLEEARTRGPSLIYTPSKPALLGTEVVDVSLDTLVPFIDWTPFFASWDLIGQYPAILDDAIVGAAARDLWRDAQAMLKTLVEERWLTAKGVVGLFPANRDGDDIIVYTDETRTTERARLHTLRQQMDKGQDGRSNYALSDFIAPVGTPDWIGGFAVTAGLGEEAASQRFKDANDDYGAIMVKALADRFAEAFAEWLHHRARVHYWGYAADEGLSPAEMIGEKYKGIRPAPGYPAQPDHTEKHTLFDLLGARSIGMDLTESLAMTPPASVSGLYFSHPAAEYFGVGRIERDQVADYAARKGWDLATSERWLSPILAYS